MLPETPTFPRYINGEELKSQTAELGIFQLLNLSNLQLSTTPTEEL